MSTATNDDATPEPDDLDEPNEATVIRRHVKADVPKTDDEVPEAEQTSLSLPRISAYGDDTIPGPASSVAATSPEDEPTERTSRRQSPTVEEQLDAHSEPNEATAIRRTYAPPSAPPPTAPPTEEPPAAQVIPDPEPRPVPDPSPFPEPTPVPGPDPVPDPEPTPTPVPEPGPAPEPEPVPEPDPVSETTVEATYQPFVKPSGMLVQGSPNGQAHRWAPPPEDVPTQNVPAETPADQVYDSEPAYATGYAEEAFAVEGANEWQSGYGYAAEQEPLEQDFGDYGTQQAYVSSLMAGEAEDNPSTWVVLLWVGAIFMIVLLVLGVWLMTL